MSVVIRSQFSLNFNENLHYRFGNPNKGLLGSKSDFLPLFFPIFTPILRCQWLGLNTTVLSPVDRLWHLIAQRTLLGSCYTGDSEKITTLSCKVEWNFSVMVQANFELFTFFEIINLTVSGRKHCVKQCISCNVF